MVGRSFDGIRVVPDMVGGFSGQLMAAGDRPGSRVGSTASAYQTAFPGAPAPPVDRWDQTFRVGVARVGTTFPTRRGTPLATPRRPKYPPPPRGVLYLIM